MKTTSVHFRIHVDPSNPGQFFACCGLLELAGRKKPGAEGWFEHREFCIATGESLDEFVRSITSVKLTQLDLEDSTASPIHVGAPFNLRLDWWKDSDTRLNGLKVWAGTMESFRIARAMQGAMREEAFSKSGLLDEGRVAFDPDNLKKKVEPFYFDARRGPNSHSRDVGFSPNDLGMTTTAFPAVEFLCLIGLQRARPVPTKQARVYDYYTWSEPIPSLLLPVAISGQLPNSRGFRFESWFRTGQKKHKAFITANPIT